MNALLRGFACGLVLLAAAPAHAAAALEPSRPSMPGREISLEGQSIDLTLDDTVFLGLRNNRAIHGAYLERTAQKFDLEVAQDRFAPKIVVKSRHIAAQNQNDRYSQTEVTPETTLLSHYGTRFSLSWNNRVTLADDGGYTRNDGASFTIVQPLLRGAGRDVVTAPLRRAHLNERVNRLKLKATVSDTITRIIAAYHELLRTQEQAEIARDALARSRQLVEMNKTLIANGFMAETEIVQVEADVSVQEAAVLEAANQLEAARLGLLRLLALDLDTRIRAIDTLAARYVRVSQEQALATAREQQPAYLIQRIAVEQAALDLAVARNENQWDVSLIGGSSQVRDRYPSESGYRTDHSWENRAGIKIDIPFGDLSRRQAEVHARVNVRNQDIRLAEAQQAL
ncbi:MAG: TolC family protein, partial [Azoarcus sp.]|nr:TolC family protein [Azoarcus sp.]